MLLNVLIAASPLIVIFFCILIMNKPADVSGLWALLFTLIVAIFYFDTPWSIALTSTCAGLIASLPLALTVGAAIYQVMVMGRTGAIARVAVVIKTMFVSDKASQVLILSVGFSILLLTLGAVPPSTLPPIMLALGYTTKQVIALPNVGNAAACTFALLGVPVQILANFCGISVIETSELLSSFTGLGIFGSSILCLWMVGGFKLTKEGLIPSIAISLICWLSVLFCAYCDIIPVTGIVMSCMTIVVLAIWVKIRGKAIFDRSVLTEKDLAAEARLPLLYALSPWLLLIFFAILINIPALPFKGWVNAFPMRVNMIPNSPIAIKMFSQTYFWIPVSLLLSLPLLKPQKGLLADIAKKWAPRATRSMLAAAVYFSIAYVFNHSGKNIDWQLVNQGNNMILVLAQGASTAFGNLYGTFSPFIGLLSGVMSGSQTASIATFTSLHIETAKLIGQYGPLVAVASAMGAGISAMISPVKLMTDRRGRDQQNRRGKRRAEGLGHTEPVHNLNPFHPLYIPLRRIQNVRS